MTISQSKPLRVALVHDFLVQYGGAERVLEAFLGLWPKAPVYTLYYDQKKLGERFERYDIRPSYLSRLWAPPPARYQWFLPFYPRAIESFDLSGYDLVISDSSAFAKGVITSPPTRHISYFHTPTRYLWQPEDRATMLRGAPALLRPLARNVLNRLQNWDARAAQRPDYLIANSNEVAKRIKKYYHRQADMIIYPPVTTNHFRSSSDIGDYWVLLGRLEAYKAPRIAIEAATKLNLKLKVIGTGRMAAELKLIAGPTIEFLGWQSDAETAQILAHAQALIFPPLEDAGIVPLEAMAAGRPVLAYGAGGALETIIPGVTGEFFAEQTVASLAAALLKFRPEAYDSKKIREHAKKYDDKIFQAKIEKIIKVVMAQNLK